MYTNPQEPKTLLVRPVTDLQGLPAPTSLSAAGFMACAPDPLTSHPKALTSLLIALGLLSAISPRCMTLQE